MIAFKGFSQELRGHGGYQFEAGQTYEEPRSKTISEGFHCTENPFECLSYFPLTGKNRYFMVDVGGDIDEDEGERIAATKMTLVKELNIREFAMYGMVYIIQHPLRRNWEKCGTNIDIAKDKAVGREPGSIAIARGKAPKAKGEKGAVIGLIQESATGVFDGAKCFTVGDKGTRPDVWYTLKKGEVVELAEEGD